MRSVGSKLARRLLALLCLVCLARGDWAAQQAAVKPGEGGPSEKPKIRAVTAFIRLDRARYRAEIKEALAMLTKAKSTFEDAGYEVQTIRITTQPFPEYIKDLPREDALAFFREYDALAHKEGFDAAIGPAMLADTDDPKLAELLGEILVGTSTLEGGIVVAGEDGIHWNAVRAAAKTIKYVSLRSPHSQGNFNFAATALVPPLTPFYPGSYHTGPGHQFAVALQSANVVAAALGSTNQADQARPNQARPNQAQPDQARQALAAALGEHARAIEAAALRVQKQSGWEYAGIDLSPAPLKEVSIGGAIERFIGAKFGASGTMTAAAVITGALEDIQVKRTGYSGLMLPVLEDSVLAERWSEGAVNLDALLAYSAVCGTGLEVVPLPGSANTARLERIIGDVATLAAKWHKPLSARLLPVAGKQAGDMTEFDDPFLVNAKIQDLVH